MPHVRLTLALALAAGLLPAAARAQEAAPPAAPLAAPPAAPLAAPLAEPGGEVLLTVTGDIAVTNADGAARFDLAMLEDLGPESFATSTLWTDGVREFEGVPLHVLLDRLGVEGGRLTAMALNDYAVEIPVSDAVEGGPMVAFALDGAPMSVRDKGPLWIVYPYDADPDYQSEVIYSRSIWQLDRIAVDDGA